MIWMIVYFAIVHNLTDFYNGIVGSEFFILSLTILFFKIEIGRDHSSQFW